MRPWLALVCAACVCSFSGCKAFERLRGKPAEPVSRTRDDDPYRPPKNYLDAPKADARDNAPDVRGTARGMIDGVVIDAEGGRVAYADVQIELNDNRGGAPIQADPVQADRTGYFQVRGLKPNESYTLTARTRQGNRDLVAQSVVRVPGKAVRLQLRERDELQLPPGKTADAGNFNLFDPPGKSLLGSPGKPAPVPLSGDADLPFPNEARPRGGADYSPDRTVPAPVRPAPRGDLVAPGPPTLDRPLPANIPGPKLPGVLPPPNTESQFGPGSVAQEFTLMDTLGRERRFPTARPGELVLLYMLDTATTGAKDAALKLNVVQAKYIANGLEVIGVVADDAADAESMRRAKSFGEGLNYSLYVEPVAATLRARLGVKSLPAALLLDAAGRILWQGDPAEADALDRAMRERR